MGKKKRNNIKLTQEDLRKMEETRVRRKKKEAGFFDGRYCSKPHGNKKYSRKVKHKGKGYEE